MTGNRKTAAKSTVSVGEMIESIVGCKWSMSVLDAIVSGVHRPADLRRACEGISSKVLNERLRKLTRFGVVERIVYPVTPPRVEYRLTRFGSRFVPLIAAVRELQAEVDTRDS